MTSKTSVSSTLQVSPSVESNVQEVNSARSVDRSTLKLSFARDLIEDQSEIEEEILKEDDTVVSSESSYEEYQISDTELKRIATLTEERNRVSIVIEQWKEWQKALAAAQEDKMPTKGSPKVKGMASKGQVIDDDDDEDPSKIRDRMIRDLQEDIRLEEYKEKQGLESELAEGEIRGTQLEETAAVLSQHWSAYQENLRILEQEERWTRYMICDRLPDPGSLPEINTFAYLWRMEEEQASMDMMQEKCTIMIRLLNKLEDINRLSIELSESYRIECKEVARELRKRLQRWIDFACYTLLRNIETNLIKENIKTTRYVHSTDKTVCCFWAPIPLPVGLKRFVSTKEQEPIEIHFEDLKLTVRLPVDLDCHLVALRGLWLDYDRYSRETHSYQMPELPEHLHEQWAGSSDFVDFAKKEYEEKIRIWKEQVEGRRLRVEQKRGILERIVNPPTAGASARKKKGKKKPRPAGKQMDPDALMEVIFPAKSEILPYLPTPDEIIRQREEEARLEARRLLFIQCEKTEVNMRKYRILGGVLIVDLLYQPPQPKDLGNDTYLTTLELPKEPKNVTFSRRYVKPQPVPDSERTPEVIEAEMNALETAMEALILITLKLPDKIMWFEPPLIAQWTPEKEIWSNKYIYDVKFNEEQQTIAFRSGKLGVYGLAAYRFANLPFQSWELKPETGKNGREYGGVVFSITAAMVQVEFIVREDKVCLNSLTGHSTDPLKHVLGEYTELEPLIKQLQQLGCDLFPGQDAISYLSGINIKHPPTENHLRQCMSMLSTTYVFAWSRWNVTRDFREIVLQSKEVHGCMAKERTNLMLLVTPSRTMRVKCTEVSSEFSDLPYDDENETYYADLYHLAMSTAGIKTRLCMSSISYKLMTTVARLLERTNVISLSS